MARASAAVTVEQCWTLLGERRGRVWHCRCERRVTGERTRVEFDAVWVLQREEDHGDVVGFLHTHPDGPDTLSPRDVRTMRAWCLAFGKPLLCLIASPNSLRGWRFDNDESAGVPLDTVEMFSRGIAIGVESHGG